MDPLLDLMLGLFDKVSGLLAPGDHLPAYAAGVLLGVVGIYWLKHNLLTGAMLMLGVAMSFVTGTQIRKGEVWQGLAPSLWFMALACLVLTPVVYRRAKGTFAAATLLSTVAIMIILSVLIGKDNWPGFITSMTG